MVVPPPDDGISVGELSRRLTDVFTRFEGLARRLEEGQFVRTELYLVYKEQVNSALAALQSRLLHVEQDKASKGALASVEQKVKDLDDDKVDQIAHNSLENRVAQLEDDKKWLVRLVIGFIVLGVLGLLYAASGGSSP